MSFHLGFRDPCALCRAGFAVVLGVLATLAAVIQPGLAQNLVQNSSFAVTGGSTSFQFGTYNGYAPTATLANWSSPGGYNYVFLPTSTVAQGTYGNLSLWSPVSSPSAANGFNNAGPTGGNFIAADSAFGQAAIIQTINGLQIGHNYQLSFAWAGAQQSGFSGVTTDYWQVTFAGKTKTTPTITVQDHGFSGWLNQTFNFVATSATDTLSFFAVGTPTGVPPFALLASVSLVEVPEPASMAIMATGICLIGFARWRRASEAASIPAMAAA